MRRVGRVTVISVLLLLCSCSAGRDGTVGRGRSSGSSTTATSLADDGTTGLVGQPKKGTIAAPEATAPRSGATVSAEYTCGPGDGPWIAVTATLDRDGAVAADLLLGGQLLFRSPTVGGRSGQQVAVGFDPHLRSPEDNGRTATLLLRTAPNGSGGGVGEVLATTYVRLALDGTRCG